MQIDFLKMNETMVRASEVALNPKEKTKSGTEALSKSFASYLKDNLNEVNKLQNESTEMTKKFAMGEVENVHDLMIASEKAALALKVASSLRKKCLEAYREISQTRL